jgi:3alpha(or 20beta)-hydroxysteroid dehydrogenase
MVGRLAGKVAVVSGAARGQGAAFAAAMVREGARVIVADVLDEEGEATARLLGDGASYRHLDVRLPDSWAGLVEWTRSNVGEINVLVNNAGILRVGAVETMSIDDYRDVIEVNQVGCFLGMQAVIGSMRAAGGGSIINMSSVAGLHGTIGVIGYAASKYAVRGMTRSAALELGKDRIRVNSIHPGTIDTPMVNAGDFDSIDRDAYFSGIPAQRMGRPSDVAGLVVFLASDESDYCTGGEYIVDGGASAGTRAI